LMTLAGEQYHVLIVHQLEGARDRRPSILDSLVLHSTHAGLDVVEDPFRIFGPRVVARDDRDVGFARRNRSHLRPLTLVAIATRSENDDQPAGRKWPNGVDGTLEG